MNEEIRRDVEDEIRDIPSCLHLLEMVRPLSSGQIQWIMRLGDALAFNGGWNGFGAFHLGKVVVSGRRAPVPLKDLRLFVEFLNPPEIRGGPSSGNVELCFHYGVCDE